MAAKENTVKGPAIMEQQNARCYLNKILQKLEYVANRSFCNGNINLSMTALSVWTDLLYSRNTCYTAEAPEALLEQLAQTLPELDDIHPVEGRILFYDGFGLNNRGLVQIYLKALVKLGTVIYVTDQYHQGDLPDVLKIVETSGGQAVWLKNQKPVERATELHALVKQWQPKWAFLYTTPSDVSGLAAFRRWEGKTHRYQINLTDHAYWLGLNCFDTCIEFRDYGAAISKEGRGISANKLVKLPFYPAIDYDRSFEGFPFPLKPEQKVIFSGGALYKTMGGENRYYQIVDYILKTFPESVFWYAGTGDASKIKELQQQYPSRVYLTPERKDLFQVMENCYLYLSTYPLCGGLMFQYAASAGKIPVTLRYDDVSDDFLLNQETLGIQFQTMEQIQQELCRLFCEDAYLEEKQQRVKNAVLNQADFEGGLASLLRTGDTGYSINFKTPDTDIFRGTKESVLTKKQVAMCVSAKHYAPILPYVPFVYFRGIVARVMRKLEEIWK